MYNKTNWIAGQTDVSAENLNKIEEGIYNNSLELSNNVENVEGSYVTVDGSVEGIVQDIEVLGNTVQDINNLVDIRSTGIDNGDGTFKYELVSCGKNLFDGGLEEGAINYLTGTHIESVGQTRSIKYTKVPNGAYLYVNVNSSLTERVDIVKYDKFKNVLGREVNVQLGIKLPDDVCYIRINYVGYDKNNVFSISTQATAYEPYTETRATINLPCQLEKVGDVADRLYFDRVEGAWCVDKDIANVTMVNLSLINSTLEGDDNVCYRVWGNFKDNLLINTKLGVSAYSQSIISNKFVGISYRDFLNNKNLTNHIAVKNNNGYTTDNQEIQIRFSASEVSTINEAVEYVKNNPINIRVLQETQKIILPKDVQVQLNSFFGTTNIYLECGDVEGTLKATVSKSIGASVQANTEAINKLDNRVADIEGLKESQKLEYETDKGYIVCNDTKNGVVEGLKLEGRTLVNKYPQPKSNSYLATGKIVFAYDSGYIFNTRHCYDVRNFSREITVISTTDKPIYVEWLYDNGTTVSYGGLIKQNFINSKIVLPSNCSSISVGGNVSDGWSVENAQQADILILEGDHTQNPPSYFEGLMSVGEDVEVMEVGTRKEDGNLFDTYTTTLGQSQGITNIHRTQTQITLTGSWYQEFGLIRVEPNTSYSISYEKDASNGAVAVFGENHSYDIVLGRTASTNVTFNTGNRQYIYLVLYASAGTPNTVTFSNIVLNKGTTPIPYEQHKSHTKPLYYYNAQGELVPISQLHAWDSIEERNGKYYYHKRSDKVVLNGSEKWVYEGSYTNDDVFGCYIEKDVLNMKDWSVIISDKFPKIQGSPSNILGIEGFNINAVVLGLRISKSKLSTADVAGFKAWLATNNVTVVYQLATEEVYEVVNLDLDTYEGETMLMVNSGAIVPKVSFKVSSYINNIVLNLKSRVNELERSFTEYAISQNAMMLNTRYISDTTEFTVNTYSSVMSVKAPSVDDKLYNLIKDNIAVGKHNYDRNWMEELITFYWFEFKLSDEMFDELMLIIELQHEAPAIEGEGEVIE